MKKIYSVLTLLFLFLSMQIIAQEKTITGVVTSAEDGLTIPGVTVVLKGTSIGTTTDIYGLYQLENVAPESILVFSFIGMETLEKTVGDQSAINVVLETNISQLDEVVVIGYGTVKKKDVTGAVSIVDSKTISKLSPVKIEQALQGTMTGVNVTEQSGAPGAGLDIRIRGISTNVDASPVAIIDGYEGDLNTLNPNDIETITVLKDAQAAIYGTIAANGIILITTKKGKRNTPTTIKFNSTSGLQETTRKLPVLNATEYAVLLNESYASAGRPLPFPDVSGLGKGTNWQDQLFSTAPIFDNNISITGGSAKMTYSLSASDLRQKGIIGGDKAAFERSTARLSMGADFTDWLKFNSAITYTHIDRTSFNDFGLGSVLFNAVNMPSTVPVYNPDGSYYIAPANVGIEIINPMQQIANTFNSYYLNKLNGNFGLEAKFAKHFTATARIGFNSTFANGKSFTKVVDYGESKVFNVPRSSVYQNKENFNDYTFDAFVNYDNTFGEDHHITGTIGTTVFQEWGNGLNATGYDVPNNSWDFADISLTKGYVDAISSGSYTYDQRRLSYFARVQYDYRGKYLLSAMYRRDASSRFGPDNAVGYFPSATLGWILSNENFLKDVEQIDFLKIRASYGILGSDKIGSFGYISQLTGEGVYVLNGQLVYGTAIGTLPNPGIKWEQSEQIDVGMDLTFLNERMDFTADYFVKTTKDLLIGSIPVSGILGTFAPGASSPTINAGTVRNNGFEFALGFRGPAVENFSYRINYNITILNNEVLKVDNGTGIYPGGSFGVGQGGYPAAMEVGQPMGYFYGYKTNGLFQTQEEVDSHPSQQSLGSVASPGDIRFVDVNGDGVLNSDDKTYIGDPIPDFVMGFNLSLRFKDFDFVAYAFASIGNDIVRNYERTQPDVNRLSTSLDRWTGPGTSNTVPRVTYGATANTIFSEYYVEDGSYLRLQRISLGYRLPQTLTQKVKIDEVRFFVAVNNLVTLTKYMGFDPGTSSGSPIGGGFDSGAYPAARTYWFGFSINL